MSAAASSPRMLVWLAAGFVVWCGALVALYAVHAIGCAFAWPAVPLRLGLVAIFLVHVAAIAAMWRGLAARPVGAADGGAGSFLVAVALWATIAAVAATVLVLGPPLLLASCI